MNRQDLFLKYLKNIDNAKIFFRYKSAKEYAEKTNKEIISILHGEYIVA